MAFLNVRSHCATMVCTALMIGLMSATALAVRAASLPDKAKAPASLPQEINPEPATQLQPLEGFKIDMLMMANGQVNGSWISMAKDPQGRILLGGQRGQPITRVTIKDGAVVKQELLKLPVSECMGMLYAFDYLYIDGFGKDN